MNKSSLIVLSIIILLFVFVAGGGLGIFYQIQKTAPQIEKLQTLETSVKALSSKVVSSINANGQVLSIDGRDITLFYEKEVLTISAKDDVEVFSFTAPNIDQKNASGSPMQKIDFSQIKKGDNLNVALEILSDGTIKIRSIIIILPIK
jgi:hypothetical protein